MRLGKCHLWTGYRDKCGYGKRGGKLAHRTLWIKQRGPIPAGLCVLHKCDTPACVRLSHLFLGTHAENMADMTRKGRKKWVNARASNGNAKLEEKAVGIIRKSQERTSRLAFIYGVHKSTIQRIRSGVAWL